MVKTQTKGRGVLGRLLQATPEQAKDTGMAMVLICLLLASGANFPGSCR